MAKTYWMRFGSGDPRTFTGLAPTFLTFTTSGATVAPPSISEFAPWGLYYFTWGTTTSIAFLADAATTSPGSTGRYVTGVLDPADRADEYGTSIVALGTTSVALGTTAVAGIVNQGTTLVAIGNTSIAIGTSIVGTMAFGTTLAAIGSTLNALGTTAVALGTTTAALGTTTVALGTTAVAGILNQGTTLVAVGNTSIAIGTSIVGSMAFGTTLAAIGNTLSALGTTSVALGTSTAASGVTAVGLGNTILAIAANLSLIAVGIGSTASSFGTSSTDPVDLFGYLKRLQENFEGNQTYFKTGTLTIYSRGSSYTLATKTMTNSVSTVVKT